MHRKNLKYFKNKFSQSLVSDLSQKNVGISKKFSEWAGNTQIIIPLSKNILKDKKTDLTISELEQAVNKDLDKKKKGIEVKSELSNLVKEKVSEERKLLDEKKKEVTEKEKVLTKSESEQVQKLEELKKEPEPKQDEIKKVEAAKEELKKEKDKISEEKKELQEKEIEIAKLEKKIEKAAEDSAKKTEKAIEKKTDTVESKDSKEKQAPKIEQNQQTSESKTTDTKNLSEKNEAPKEEKKIPELKKEESTLVQKAEELKKEEPKKGEEPKKEEPLAREDSKKEEAPKETSTNAKESPSKESPKELGKDSTKDVTREATKEEVQPIKPQDPKILEKEIAEKAKQIQEISKELTDLKKTVEDKLQKSDNLIGDKVLFLQVVKYENDGHFTNDLWVLDPEEEEGLYKSPFENICGRDFKVLSTGVLVVGFEGQESDNSFHHLVLLNKDDLTVKKISKENIYWRSQLFLMDKKIYGYEISEDKKIYLSRFSEDLVFEARSSEPVNIYSDITFNKSKIFVTSKLQGSTSTSIMILNKDDLKVLKSFKPTPKRILKK